MKRLIKRLFAFACAAALTAGTCCTSLAAGSFGDSGSEGAYTADDTGYDTAVSVQTLSSDTLTYDTDGTTVLISDAEDLVAFSELVAAGECPDASLTADITIGADDGFAPIGGSLEDTEGTSEPVCYTGVFYGNDYTITFGSKSADGFTNDGAYYTALFAGLADGGVIRDLTIAGYVTGGTYTAGVAAYVTGGTMVNVTNKAKITGADAYTGGIIGGTSSDCTVTLMNCINSGTVSGSGNYAGGIVGIFCGTAYGCTHKGTVTGASCVGGFAGQTYSGAALEECRNTGTVSTDDGDYAGGITGRTYGTTLTYCVNKGSVTGANYSGGITAALFSSSEVSYCINESAGSVSSSCESGTYYAGGITGHMSTGCELYSCCNRGTVTAPSAGGIAGYMPGSTSSKGTLIYCYNNGTVTGTDSYAGGIAAYMYYMEKMQYCYSAGTISNTNEDGYCGGIAGAVKSKEGTSGTGSPEQTYGMTNACYNFALESEDYDVYGTIITASNSSNAGSLTISTSYDSSAMTTKTEEELLSSDMITLLNTSSTEYKKDSTGSVNSKYPIFVWEGHNYGDPVWTWAEDYSTAEACITSTTTSSYSRTVTGVVVSDVTVVSCTGEGEITYTATAAFNGKIYTDTQTAVTAAAGHSYGDPVWTWAEDYSTAEAAFTCRVCGDVQTASTDEITYSVTEATCEEDGQETYSAAVTFNGTTYTGMATVTLAATGHSYGSDGYCTVCGAYNGEDDADDDGSGGTDDGSTGGTDDDSTGGTDDGSTDGTDDGSTDGTDDGSTDGTDDGSSDGTDEGSTGGTDDGSTDGTDDGTSGGTDNGTSGGVSAAKKSQTIKVKSGSLKKTYKASKLKKKKQTFKIKASAKGKLTFSKKSGNKKIKVSKAGKVTVKKGLAKGTYKVKVQIKAAATAKYKAKTVTKTIKIIVKK